MKDFKSLEFLSNFRVSSTLQKRNAPLL